MSEAAQSRKGHLILIGDVIDDILVAPRGPIRPDTDTDAVIETRPGGSAANVAAWLGWARQQRGSTEIVEFIGTVGERDLDRHSALLEQFGVQAHLRGSQSPTGSIVLLLGAGTRTMLTSRGANGETGPDHVNKQSLEQASHLHFSGYTVFNGAGAQAWQKLLGAAAALGVTTSVDPGSSGYLDDHGAEQFLRATEGTTIVMPNLDEGRALTGLADPAEIAAALLDHYPKVVLTLGDQGVAVAERGAEVQFVPSIAATDAIDSTGAGDAFAAGFLDSWLAESSLLDSAFAACRLGAKAVRMTGARPQ